MAFGHAVRAFVHGVPQLGTSSIAAGKMPWLLWMSFSPIPLRMDMVHAPVLPVWTGASVWSTPSTETRRSADESAVSSMKYQNCGVIPRPALWVAASQPPYALASVISVTTRSPSMAADE
jgi:hypothetical protein